MICTLLLRSPFIGETEAERVAAQLETRSGVDNRTGFELYSFTSGQLAGSYDHRVRVSVERDMWVPYDDVRHPKTGKAPAKVRTLPFLTIEGSVHKAMVGHNVFGGPLCPVESARWFVGHVQRGLAVALPPALRWHYERLDVAEVYNAGSAAGAAEFKRSLELARYSRRKPTIYEGCVMFVGNTSTWKAYLKGLEFASKSKGGKKCASDFQRVSAVLGRGKAVELQELANNLVRVELSIKSRLIQDRCRLMGMDGTIGDGAVDREWVEGLLDRETDRVVEDGRMEMEVVRNHDDVKRRLHEVYGARLSRSLYGTWSTLALSGEQYARQFTPARTLRRHVRQLQDAGVAWIGSDVFVGERASLIPLGFSLARNSPFRLTGELPEVAEALAPYRKAA